MQKTVKHNGANIKIDFQNTVKERTLDTSSKKRNIHNFVINGKTYVVYSECNWSKSEKYSCKYYYNGVTFPDSDKQVIEYILSKDGLPTEPSLVEKMEAAANSTKTITELHHYINLKGAREQAFKFAAAKFKGGMRQCYCRGCEIFTPLRHNLKGFDLSGALYFDRIFNGEEKREEIRKTIEDRAFVLDLEEGRL